MKKDKKASKLINKREAILLTLVIICLEIFVFVNMIILPIHSDNSQLKDWIDSNEPQILALEKDFNAIDTFRDKINQIQTKREELSQELPPYNIQEEIIGIVNMAADNNDIEISEIEFSNYQDLSVDEFLTQIPGGKIYEESIIISSINAKVSYPRVLYQSLYVSFIGDYEDFYRFLQTVESNKRIFPVNEVSVSRVDDMKIAGRIKIITMGYVSDSSDYFPAAVKPEEITTRDNPFVAY